MFHDILYSENVSILSFLLKDGFAWDWILDWLFLFLFFLIFLHFTIVPCVLDSIVSDEDSVQVAITLYALSFPDFHPMVFVEQSESVNLYLPSNLGTLLTIISSNGFSSLYALLLGLQLYIHQIF